MCGQSLRLSALAIIAGCLSLSLVIAPLPAHAFAASNGRRRTKARHFKTNKSHHHLSNSAPDRRLTSAATTNATILLDLENIRGKSGFALSHGQLLDKCTVWAERRNLYGQVTLVVDHGSEASGYWLKERGLGVVFAGPSQKADDIIARDVAYMQSTLGRDVVVVTADRELMRRCHRSSARSGRARLELVPPSNFIEDLERVVYDRMKERELAENENEEEGADGVSAPEVSSTEHNVDGDNDPQNELAAAIEQKMEDEIQLWGRVVDTEIQLKRRGGSQKKKQKLSKQLFALKEKLASLSGGPSTLEKVTATNAKSNNGGADLLISREMQNDLMARWEGRRKNSLRGERTGDRVVLAELLRRQLEAISGYDGNDNITDEESIQYPSAAHARYVNVLAGRLFSASTETASALSSMEDGNGGAELSCDPDVGEARKRSLEPLRLVVISDTHGYETTLTSEGSPLSWDITSTSTNGATKGDEIVAIPGRLPDGDVLLHLGDFAIDASSIKKRDALQRFDKWLAQQPHPHKIVLRGNHDPFTVSFPNSNSTYIATPQALEINGWKLSCVPFVTHRRYQVPPGDAIVTHIPPKAILDRCESGALAGCSYLRSSVEKMAGKSPPRLWLCGHIHESRGHKYVRFGHPGTPETLVINAANANPGIACALIHGPVVTDLREESEGGGEGMVVDAPPVVSNDFDWSLGRSYLDFEVPEGVGQLLLAVDLGLRMGASLFNDRGELIRYEQLYFEDADELFDQVPLLLQTWEAEANKSAEINDELSATKQWTLTHVAIEGGDVTLLEAWRSAVEIDDPSGLPKGGRGARLHTVRPEEWRADLLVKKEKTSGRKSKEAARLIARQVVDDFSAGTHSGKFKTDVAEAVTLGFYMSRRLGWIESNVRRATNSMILVPRR